MQQMACMVYNNNSTQNHNIWQEIHLVHYFTQIQVLHITSCQIAGTIHGFMSISAAKDE